MANDLTKFFGNRAPQKVEKSVEAFKAFSHTQIGSGRALLKLRKTGEWVFGVDSEELKKGTQLYANPLSFSSGYVAWHKGQVENEVMQPIIDGPVDPSRLKEVQAKKGWEDQSSIDLLLPDDNQPVQLVYKTSSIGGLRMLIGLAGEFAVAQMENPERTYAVIELGADSYEHKEYGTVYTPEFNIVGWLDADGNKITNRKKLV